MKEARYEKFKDRAGKWRWRLIAKNGRIIAVSGESFERKEGASWGIGANRRNAGTRAAS